MIKIFSLYNGKTTDITQFTKTITLSASKDQPSRKLEGKLAYPIFDLNQPKIQIMNGFIIWIVDDMDGEIFRGMVVDRDIDSSTQELAFTAYDFMYHVLKSKTSHNFKKVTPEQITTILCNEVGVITGSLAKTGIMINRIIKSKTIYSTIMECYTQASKQNNKLYIPIMQSSKLNVIEKGQVVSGYTLQSDVNITNLNYKDSINSMVNRVKIYDENGNYLKKVENTSWVNQFGVLEDSYEVETGVNPLTVANTMIYGLDFDITVNSLGNAKCITGYAVACRVFYLSTMKKANLYIDADTHTWDLGNGSYTMQLTLSLSNLMDSQVVS